MTKVLTDSAVYPAIAAAIRGKNGLADTYSPSDMAGAIGALNPDSSTFAHKFVGANGEYSAADDSVDGYSSVEVFVPNSYAEEDEGCVVDDGVLVQQTALTVRASGTYDTTLNDSVTVDMGGSVLGTKSISENGDYSAEDDSLDGYSSVTVDVPNSYSQSDEGKVVSSGALVAQTSLSVTENGTYDTTTKNEVAVNVTGGSSQVTPSFQGLSYGYVATNNYFYASETMVNYANVFELDAGKYCFFVGETVSNRLRGMFFDGKSFSDFSDYIYNPHENTQIYAGILLTGDDPTNSDGLQKRIIFTAQSSGVLIFVTSNNSTTAPAYCFKIS